MLQNVCPTLSQNRIAAGVLFIIMRGMPVKFCEGTVNDQIIRASDFEAKIDVRERAYRPSSNPPARSKTSRRVSMHALDTALQLRVICNCRFVPGCSAGKPQKAGCAFVHAHPDSRMLNRAARIQQTRAYRSDLRSLDMLGHDREPLRIDNFDRVVEEKKPWRITFFCSVIFRC